MQENVSLAPFSTFGIGGKSRYFISVASGHELVAALRAAKEKSLKYRLIAGGSNVVFGDGTFLGLTIHFKANKKSCRFEGQTTWAEANTLLAKLIVSSIKHNLAGLETLSGIPGTVGGAIVGNAGAYGQSISDHLVQVEVFDPATDRVEWLSRSECAFAYRDSLFKRREFILLQAEFKLEKGDGEQLAAKAKEIIETRTKKYPLNLKSPGSFFKNILASAVPAEVLALIPPEKIIEGKIPTGYLLEEVGAKGMKYGHLEIAPYHGNLLINKGGATCQEVKELAAKLKGLVKDKFGLILEEEVRYL